jgi:hypothetical protein
MAERLPSEPPAAGWTPEGSEVLRAIGERPPSKRRGYRAGRIGKKAVAKLNARIALLEAALADRPTQAVEIKHPSAQKTQTRIDRALPVDNGRQRSADPAPGLPPDPDSRRPDAAVVEARAVAAEVLHRQLAEGFRRHAFAMNLLASRGLSTSRWSNPYWRSSPYRPGF